VNAFLGLGRAAVFAAALVLGAIVPTFVSEFRAGELAYVGVYFIAILGLDLLTGYTGQISLGHGAFMAVGGYTTAILVADHGVNDLYTIPLAALTAGAAGLLVGIPALRLRGFYLALATFGIAVAMPELLKKFSGLTHGTAGIQLFGLPGYTFGGFAYVHPLGLDLSFLDWLYYLTWTIAAFLFVLTWGLLRGRPGRAFRAIRDSEVAAAASGVWPAAYKTLAFAVSAAYAGVAGSLYVLLSFAVFPQTFPIALSLTLVVGAVVAGLGSLAGLLVGAVFVQYLPIWAGELSNNPGVPSVIYGAILIAVVIALPGGAAGLGRLLAGQLTARRSTRS
jgi:branched-chain amino acid transport system permease protein